MPARRADITKYYSLKVNNTAGYCCEVQFFVIINAEMPPAEILQLLSLKSTNLIFTCLFVYCAKKIPLSLLTQNQKDNVPR